MIPEPNLARPARGSNHVQLGPIDPGVLRRVDRLQALVMKIEIEHHAGKVEIGKILNGVVLENIVGVVEKEHAKVGHVPKDAIHGKACGAGLAQRCGCTEPVKAAEIHRPVRLELKNLFCTHRVSSELPVPSVLTQSVAECEERLRQSHRKPMKASEKKNSRGLLRQLAVQARIGQQLAQISISALN